MRQSSDQRLVELFGTAQPVAVVTGSAANRVGRCVAELLQEHGFRLAFHSHHGEPEAVEYVAQRKRAGFDSILCVGSIDAPHAAAQWLNQVQQHWGRIDLLVNAAAVWQPERLEEVTQQSLIENFAVNAAGSFLTSRTLGLAMVQQSTGGAIVEIGDWAVARPYRDFSAYFLSKGAIETMTRTLAIELASRNPRVRVNAVMPGPVMLDQGISSATAQRIADQSLLKRSGQPRDVAEAVWFLATSPFITGVCLPVDGGRTIYAGPATDAHAHPAMEGFAK